MVYLPLRKFLDKYLYAEEVAEILKKIGETPTGNKMEDIELLIKEWPRRGKNYYALFEKITPPDVRDICKKYSIDSKGDKKKLIKRIKKARLFEPDTKSDSDSKFSSKSPSQKTPGFHLTQKNSLIIGIIVTVIIGLTTMGWTSYVTENSSQNSIEQSGNNNFAVNTNYGTINLNSNTINKDTFEEGEHGDRFTDKKAGFTVQKPNANWYFQDVGNFVNKFPEFSNTITNAYLGGIIIATDRPGNVLITVDLLPENLDLSEYIDSQIKRAEELFDTDFTITKKFISPDGNWAVFEATGKLTAQEYGRQILHKYEDRLYLIQTSGDPPNIMSEETKMELKQIVESFQIII